MYYVYVLRSSIAKRRYVGITGNIDDRLRRHFAGYERSTRRLLPMDLVFLSVVSDRKIARFLEIYLKSGVGREFLDKVAGLPAGRQV